MNEVGSWLRAILVRGRGGKFQARSASTKINSTADLDVVVPTITSSKNYSLGTCGWLGCLQERLAVTYSDNEKGLAQIVFDHLQVLEA